MHTKVACALLLAALSWPAGAVAQGGAIKPGALSLSATFNSIGVELLFSGDDNANARAALEFRKTGTDTWRASLPLWRTADDSSAPGRAFYGSALLLDPGSSYDVRVTLSDPDGIEGDAMPTGSVTTRDENIVDAATLTADHYVSLDGDDGNDGSAPTRAWRTLDGALNAAPMGALVDVAPGHYAAPAARTVRSKSMTLRAHNPAATSQLQSVGGEQRTVAVEASIGARSVIEPRGSDGGAAVSAPTGAADPDLAGLPINRVGPWRQVTLLGVNDSTQSYSVWKWAASPVEKARELGFAATRDAQPIRITSWYSDTPQVDTPQKWAEQVYTNPDWQSGVWAAETAGRHFIDENGQDATTNVTDIYLRLANDANPNDNYVTIAGGIDSGLAVAGPDVHISGLEIRTSVRGITLGPKATHAVIDHNLFQVGGTGIFIAGQPGKNGVPSTYGSDHVIQDNLFRDNGLTAVDPSLGPALPWNFIKLPPQVKLGRYSETTGIGGTGGARRVVIRRNTFDGTFDGLGGYHAGFDRYSMQDADIYNNLFQNQGDDGLDLARGTINNRIWNNRFEHEHDVFSIAAPTWGPLYFFHNEAWRFGNQLNGRNADGRVPAGEAIKYGAVDVRGQPPARVFVIGNTFWSDQTQWLPAEGIVQAGDAGRDVPYLYLRNNVIRVADKAAHFEVADRWDEDADDFSSGRPDQPAVVQTSTGRFRDNVNAYRAESGQGGHTNSRAGFGDVPDADFMDSGNGDLRLKPGSALVDHGVPVPNIADRPGIDFAGAAPDIGAFEVSLQPSP